MSPFKDRFLIKGRLKGGAEGGTLYTSFDEPKEPPYEEELISPFVDRVGIAKKIVSGPASGSVLVPLSTANQISASISINDSGSNTTAIDHLTQGVEISTDRRRYNRALPILWSGNFDHSLDQVVFGVPITIESLDGVLEPFDTRIEALGRSTFETPPKGPKAQLQDGNADEYGRTSQIVQIYEFPPLTQSKPYIDSFELFGNSNTGSIKIPGVISDIVPKISPFDETSFDNFLKNSVSGSLSDISLSMSLGRSGSHKDFGYIRENQKSTATGFIFDTATKLGVDSIAFGDTNAYQRIGFLNELDAMTGSIPTNLRTGDKDRLGKFKVKFDDTRTIIFAKNEFLDVQRNLNSSSIYLAQPFLSQTIDPQKKPRFYPFVGQRKITRATSASLYATGTVRKGIADRFVRFDDTGGDDLSPFIEDFMFDNKSDSFWNTGSKIEDVGTGFSSPILSKTKIEIDLMPNVESNLSSSWAKPNYTMGYFNFKQKKWEGIGTGKSVVNSLAGGAVKTTIEKLTYGFNTSYYDNASIGSQYAVWQQAGMPISSFGFPLHAKFHATGSQLYHMSRSISHPFLLEKIVYEFSASIASPTASFTEQGHVATFFMLNQREKFSISASFPTIRLGTPNVGIGLSASLPVSINLSSGGPKTKVSSIRDLISFSNVSVFNSSATDLEKEAKAGDLNIIGNASGSFILSGTVKSPSRAEAMGVFNNGAIGLVVSNKLGGRNSLGIPTGRDLSNSVVGFNISGSSTTVGGATIYPNKTRFTNNPYIIFPDDRVVFGWQVPFHYNNHVNNVLFKNGDMTFHKGKGKIILYGSLVRDQKEFHDTLNQPLTSKAIVETIGNDPVLDQYDTEYFQMLSGSYLDTFATGSITIDTRTTRQVLGSAFGFNGSNSGSFSRNAIIVSSVERFYDTLLPDPGKVVITDNKQVVGAGVNSITLGHYIVSLGESTSIYDNDWWFSFPFEHKYKDISRDPNVFEAINGTIDTAGNLLDPPISNKKSTLRQAIWNNTIIHLTKIGASDFSKAEREDKIKHFYGIGDFVSGTVGYAQRSRTGANTMTGEGSNLKGWKYGIYSGLPSFSKMIFRREKYGQFRDMLEQRSDSKFWTNDPTSNADVLLESPVRVFFSASNGSTDPYETDSSNKSFEATSSLPYFDGMNRN